MTGPDDGSAAETVPPVERRLAAIPSADVKDYGRLMGDDDVATVETLTAYPVQCSVSIQEELTARNADLSVDRRISGSVCDEISSKRSLDCESLGEHAWLIEPAPF